MGRGGAALRLDWPDTERAALLRNPLLEFSVLIVDGVLVGLVEVMNTILIIAIDQGWLREFGTGFGVFARSGGTASNVPHVLEKPQAPVAQLDRAMVFDTIGYRFESCRAY